MEVGNEKELKKIYMFNFSGVNIFIRFIMLMASIIYLKKLKMRIGLPYW